MLRKFFVFILVGVFFSTFWSDGDLSAERVYIDITASNLRKVVVAIPPFIDGNSGAKDTITGVAMAKLLGRALAFHGFVRVVGPAGLPPDNSEAWQRAGVDFVVRGRFVSKGQKLTVEGRLQDIEEQRLLTGRRFRGLKGLQDDMVLRLADGLVEEFTGIPGISRTRIAYVSDETGAKEVFIADVLGLKRRQITRHRALCVSPRFTPDGHFLAYSTYHHGNQDLYITDLRQNKITRALSRRRGLNMAPAFAPDGRTMVVTLSKDGSPDLYLLNRRGKILRRLTARAGINVSPSFSPDGSRLVFVSDRSGQPQLYIMELSSGRTQRLTFDGQENSEPAWSPDGSRIAYTGRIDGHYHIFTISPQGGTPTRLTGGWGDYESPSWSPDSKQLVLARKRNGHSELCVMFANGKGLRTLFRLPGNQSYPQWSGRPQ